MVSAVESTFTQSILPPLDVMAPVQLLLVDMVQDLMKSEAVLRDLSVSEIIHFITVTSALKNEIEHHRQSTDQDNTKPPQFLSDTIAIVLAHILETSLDHVNACWSALRNVVWAGNTTEDIGKTNSELFKAYGLQHMFSKYRDQF